MPGSNLPLSPRTVCLAIWSVGIGLIAAVATVMQFSTGFDWGLEDFAAATLLFGVAGAVAAFVASRPIANAARLLWLGVIGLGFLIIWAEFAVGLFD
jgi:energy-converting hydrogenase Eha subunit H